MRQTMRECVRYYNAQKPGKRWYVKKTRNPLRLRVSCLWCARRDLNPNGIPQSACIFNHFQFD
nr:MAG TPA: hypothetical protein [Bacteriophage sp.]